MITYAGDESNLPDIFERINQRGTKLNKYEVFAATWIDSDTQVNSEKVRVEINNKYSALIEKGFSIDGLQEDGMIASFNLFEYLFGFGKVIVGEGRYLFSGSTKADPTETEPAAFSLACLSRGRQLSAMRSLPEFMPRSADGLIDPAAMEAGLLDAAKAVQSWISPYTSLRLNSQGVDSIEIAHGELQIVSMIARAAAGRWNTQGDWSEKDGWEDDWKALEKAMPQHYLLDIIEETWRGPLYTIAFNRVWQSEDSADTENLEPSDYYKKPIEKESFALILDSWFEKQMAREQRTRSYVRGSDKALLRFVYAGIVSHLDNQIQTFELEHLFPVSRLRQEIPEAESGWPISCIANLALFTRALNREKSKQTISEYLAKNVLPAPEKKLLDQCLLCDSASVSIPEDGLSREAYEEFLRTRWADMKEHLFHNLKVSAS
ncbi:hypothetical protein [Nocardioides jishulii]|uniref:DUF1524 domain-containing protein n=1 Tax=Nocardioides jishulii TaxID=2575440 RepID=A0A4V5TL25_9ACTN|nr:hypothetical protein [Nocardioides jishulii]QCX28484.1 hypothetical protein FCL41_13830 [Nocardioides jishulii]TKI64623.1 hypothetical protein FC770_05745 [Nocardioides jishulii]